MFLLAAAGLQRYSALSRQVLGLNFAQLTEWNEPRNEPRETIMERLIQFHIDLAQR